MGRTPPTPPPTDEYGLTKSERRRIRCIAVRSAGEAFNIDGRTDSTFHDRTIDFMIEAAKKIEQFIIDGEVNANE